MTTPSDELLREITDLRERVSVLEDAMARFVVARVTSGDGERKAMAAERARRYRQRRKQAQKGGWQQG